MRRQPLGISAGTFQTAIEKLSESAFSELTAEIRAKAKEQGFSLQNPEREPEMIPLALSPWVISDEAARYLKGLFRGIRRTVNRILSHYFEDPKLQSILPLHETELAWLKSSCPDGIPRPQTIFERFDTNLGPQVEEQLPSFQIIEFNAVGVGCIYLVPAATELLDAHLFPRLKDFLPEMDLAAPADYRHLLLQDIQTHARALDCSSCRVAFVERRESVAGGVDEFAHLVEYFKAHESPSVVADPRDLEHKNGGFLLKGEAVDVVYRDFQLEEVVSIKTHGGSVEGIEAAFAQNRVISTVFGEFDHKSLCELLTNPEFSSYLNPQEVRAARRRIPWTRLGEERKTTDWEDKEVDLLPRIREGREALVLKPNRGYGGEGVVVGQTVASAEWDKAMEEALSRKKSWVVQERVPIAKAPVMILREKGRPKLEEQFVTLGVTATARGVAFVGRCCSEPVVNITQGGAIVPVFLARRRTARS